MIRYFWFESGQHSMRSSCDPVLRLCYVCSLFRGQFCFQFISSKAPWENIVFPFVSWPCATHTLYKPHSSNRRVPCRSTSAFWTRCMWSPEKLNHLLCCTIWRKLYLIAILNIVLTIFFTILYREVSIKNWKQFDFNNEAKISVNRKIFTYINYTDILHLFMGYFKKKV